MTSPRRGIPITVADLRDYEAGQRLPNVRDARRICRCFGKALSDLLSPGAATAVHRHWTHDRKQKEAREILKLLSEKGADTGLTASFVSQEISENACRKWLSMFSASDAVAYIELGCRPIQSRNLVREGRDPALLRVCETFSIDESRTLSDRARDLRELGTDPCVAALCALAGVERSTALEWRNGGWDLLEALPWLDSPLGAVAARDWCQAGVGRDLAERLSTQRLTPAAAQAFRELGYPEQVWSARLLEWETHGVPPGLASRWQAQGFTAPEAVAWAPISPERAHRLKARGLSAGAAHERDARGRRSPDVSIASAPTDEPVIDLRRSGNGSPFPDADPEVCESCEWIPDLEGHCDC